MKITTTKRYILASLGVCMSLTLFGQSQTQAKKWFANGEYEKAKPVFAKLVKGNPKSGSLNYWYGVCLNETGEHDKALSYLQKAVDSDVENAYRYIGNYYLADGEYEQAIENYEIYLDKVDPDDKRFAEYTLILEKARHEFKFVKRVEKITIVDSVVVPKQQFLEAYTLGHESGTIGSTRHLIGGSTSTEGTAYRTEMRDKIYYSDADENGRLQLYMSYKMLDNWSKPTLLSGLPEGDNNYPYMLTDGITFYFANNNPNGLGGYDIYVTRYNSDTDRFLVAENVGMPFNSAANDYMMAIDEVNNLGWFATDRNQTDSTVCIYTFIPKANKEYYNYDTDDKSTILQAARIQSIAATQTDETAIRKAEQALFKLSLSKTNDDAEAAFTFVIDDFTDYHTLDDFKNPEARQLYISWGNKQEQLKKLTRQLDNLRTQYTQATANERHQITDQLLRMEQQHELLETEVAVMPMQIRNLEVNYTKR